MYSPLPPKPVAVNRLPSLVADLQSSSLATSAVSPSSPSLLSTPELNALATPPHSAKPYPVAAATKSTATTMNTTIITTSLGVSDQSTIADPFDHRPHETQSKFPSLHAKFHILNKLGDGAFSTVYSANNLQTGAKVAIKVVRRHEMSPSQQACVYKEVCVMNMLARAPHTVNLLDFIDSDPDFFYLVLEHVSGGELFNRIVDLTYFSESLSRHVIIQVADAVRHLHAKGIVHRDIKPENILFEAIPFIPAPPGSESRRLSDEPGKKPEGHFRPGFGGGGIGLVKLADFGLSKVVTGVGTHTPCGTVGYAAPEVVRDELYTKAVDMWAIGCVLYTMLCGFPPFYDDDIHVLTRKVARGEYSFLSPWWDDISPDARDLVSHLLELDPRKRYTVDDFFRHPWIVAGLNSSTISRPCYLSDMAANSSSSSSCGNGRHLSSSITDMRDCFNVSFAVRRLETSATARRQFMETPVWEHTFGQSVNDYGFDAYATRYSQQQQQQQPQLPLSVAAEPGGDTIDDDLTHGLDPFRPFPQHTIDREEKKNEDQSLLAKYFAKKQPTTAATAAAVKDNADNGYSQIASFEQIRDWHPFAGTPYAAHLDPNSLTIMEMEEANADWRYLNNLLFANQQQGRQRASPPPPLTHLGLDGSSNDHNPFLHQSSALNAQQHISPAMATMSTATSTISSASSSNLTEREFNLQLCKATLLNRRNNHINNCNGGGGNGAMTHRRSQSRQGIPIAIKSHRQPLSPFIDDGEFKPSSLPF